ncbi:MAG: T9SS type A sorting domain-containing protein, partial [Krumholzibacteria bacterium]|nr:T9SS type A sorting domain-containing protein [Candidatus Krumholzibacteria bacterium]
RTGTHGLREIGGSTYPQVFGALDGTGVCVNVWYREAMSTATDFMALIRLWDSDTSVFTHHAVGTGVWTGASTTHYSHHTEGWVYTPSVLPRVPGWRHLSIAMADATAELRVDGTPLATLDVLDPALINRFSVEGYRGGTGWFDDAYVRRYTEPEPTVAVGPAVVAGIDLPGPAPSIFLEQNVPNPLNPATVIAFSVPREGAVRLQVFDLQGRVVRTLVDGVRSAGRHEVSWDGRDERGGQAASGTYLYRLVAAGEVTGRKLTLVK